MFAAPIYQGNGLSLSRMINYLKEVEKKYGDMTVSASVYGDVIHIFVNHSEIKNPKDKMSTDNRDDDLFLAIF